MKMQKLLIVGLLLLNTGISFSMMSPSMPPIMDKNELEKKGKAGGDSIGEVGRALIEAVGKEKLFNKLLSKLDVKEVKKEDIEKVFAEAVHFAINEHPSFKFNIVKKLLEKSGKIINEAVVNKVLIDIINANFLSEQEISDIVKFILKNTNVSSGGKEEILRAALEQNRDKGMLRDLFGDDFVTQIQIMKEIADKALAEKEENKKLEAFFSKDKFTEQEKKDFSYFLQFAAEKGNWKLVAKILEKKPSDIFLRHLGNVFKEAASKGQIAIVKKILEKRADLTASIILEAINETDKIEEENIREELRNLLIEERKKK